MRNHQIVNSCYSNLSDYVIINLSSNIKNKVNLLESQYNQDVKPYLTPLNLMTTSQQNELTDILSQDGDIMEFCYKHHIDCANLIEKKIAIQMTP